MFIFHGWYFFVGKLPNSNTHVVGIAVIKCVNGDYHRHIFLTFAYPKGAAGITCAGAPVCVTGLHKITLA